MVTIVSHGITYKREEFYKPARSVIINSTTVCQKKYNYFTKEFPRRGYISEGVRVMNYSLTVHDSPALTKELMISSLNNPALIQTVPSCSIVCATCDTQGLAPSKTIAFLCRQRHQQISMLPVAKSRQTFLPPSERPDHHSIKLTCPTGIKSKRRHQASLPKDEQQYFDLV